MNPIVVSEYRQAVRSKAVTAILILLLLALSTMAVFIMIAYNTLSMGDVQALRAGRETFQGMYIALVVAGLLCVPTYMGIRLGIECVEDNPDLYFFTSITPHAVVRGKIMAAAGTTLLLFSVCLPFISLSQAMRGIDFPTIAWALIIAYAGIVFAAMVAMAVASLHVSRPFKILLGFGLAAAMVPYGIGICAGGLEFVDSSVGWMGHRQFLQIMGTMAGIYVIAFGMLYAVAVAMLMPAAANRALLLRGYLSAVWLVSCAACVTLGIWLHEYEIILAWFCTAMLVLTATTAFVSVEATRLSYRARTWLPRRRVLRMVAILFCNGPVSGFVWAGVMVALTMVVGVMASMDGFWPQYSADMMRRFVEGMFALYLYCTGAVYLANVALTTFVPRAGRLMVLPVAVALVVTMMVGPYVVALVVPDRWYVGDLPWKVLNITALFKDGEHASERLKHVTAGILFAGTMLAANMPWCMRHIREYRPVERTP